MQENEHPDDKVRIGRLEYLTYLTDWLSVAYTLCLDIIVPLHQEMGLFLPDSQNLPPVFREGVLEIKRKGRINDLIIADFKKKILGLYGEDGWHRFRTWFFTVYRRAPGWGEWRSLLELMNPAYIESLRTIYHVSDRQIQLLKEYDDHCFFWEMDTEDATTRFLTELREKSLSSWDQDFMQANQQDLKVINIDMVTEVTDVFLGAKDPISMNRFQSGWEDLWSNFTTEEKDIITTSGEPLLNSESPEQSPRFLPYPDTVIRYNY